VDAANPNYKSMSGVLFDKGGTVLLQAPGAMNGSYVIPSSVSGISQIAFSGCIALTSVTIPSSVTNIGSYAFYNCLGLKSVLIPASVTSIDLGAFEDCLSMSSISVEAANANYQSISGVLLNKAGTALLQAPGGMAGSYTIPSSVTSIGSEAFFACVSLTSITIPSSVTSIGNDAFWACTNLTSITIPSSVTSISYGVFGDCRNLSNVTVQATTPPILSSGSGAFSFCAAGLKIHVPSGTIGDYEAAVGWRDYYSPTNYFVSP
jgi:hypothetical protein